MNNQKTENKDADVALVFIFNHKYNKNIPILEKIYGDRFSKIIYIVPFFREFEEYSDYVDRIIPVYESSYRFEGYIAQAMYYLRKVNCCHYLIMGDDLVLHPRINENNYMEYFNVMEGDGFTTEICKINEPFGRYVWRYNRIFSTLACFDRNPFVNYECEIPSVHEAFVAADKKGYNGFTIDKSIYKIDSGFRSKVRDLIQKMKRSPKVCPYPVFGGYSDIIIIPSSNMEVFAHYCGVFAAMGLISEVGIPTAMILACERIVYEKDIMYNRGDIWGLDIKEGFNSRYEYSFSRLVEEWPEKQLYIHPIKFSQWRI